MMRLVNCSLITKRLFEWASVNVYRRGIRQISVCGLLQPMTIICQHCHIPTRALLALHQRFKYDTITMNPPVGRYSVQFIYTILLNDQFLMTVYVNRGETAYLTFIPESHIIPIIEYTIANDNGLKKIKLLLKC